METPKFQVVTFKLKSSRLSVSFPSDTRAFCSSYLATKAYYKQVRGTPLQCAENKEFCFRLQSLVESPENGTHPSAVIRNIIIINECELLGTATA